MFTLVGGEDELVEALLAGVRVAVERIDLRRHEGVHPRIGAADVVPIVPLRPHDLPRARATAERFARLAAAELRLPVFLYEPPGRGPAFYRRGGPEALQRRLDTRGAGRRFRPGAPARDGGRVITGRGRR